MSLIKIYRKKININLFTTPSHSQKLFIFSKFKQFYKHDISENEAYEPQNALIKAQVNASKIYGTKSTFFLTNGSTSGIMAAVLTCTKPGEKILIWDKAHKSHNNAAKLAGLEPVYYEADKINEWGIYSFISIEKIEQALIKEKISAVIITSPTYEGIVSDIRSLKQICTKYGTYLIVDEAHGALYPFCDKLPESAIYQGADFIIQSLHKTAGGLNPTALLHSNTNLDVQKSLNLITTTSPSYPLLTSIEKNINYLNSKKGQQNISELIKKIEDLKTNLTNLEFYNGDLTKILVKSPKITGFELSDFLYKHKIEDEKTNEKSTMLLCGVGTTTKKLKRLEKILKKL